MFRFEEPAYLYLLLLLPFYWWPSTCTPIIGGGKPFVNLVTSILMAQLTDVSKYRPM